MATATARLAAAEYDNACAWLEEARKGPMEPIAAEVWVTDHSFGHILLMQIGGGAGCRPVGRSNLTRHPARQPAVSCSRKPV